MQFDCIPLFRCSILWIVNNIICKTIAVIQFKIEWGVASTRSRLSPVNAGIISLIRTNTFILYFQQRWNTWTLNSCNTVGLAFLLWTVHSLLHCRGVERFAKANLILPDTQYKCSYYIISVYKKYLQRTRSFIRPFVCPWESYPTKSPTASRLKPRRHHISIPPPRWVNSSFSLRSSS